MVKVCAAAVLPAVGLAEVERGRRHGRDAAVDATAGNESVPVSTSPDELLAPVSGNNAEARVGRVVAAVDAGGTGIRIVRYVRLP